MSRLGHCMCCGNPIYSRFVWCEECERTWGVHNKPASEWPANAREMWLADKREQNRERKLLRYLADAVPFLDVLFYGEYNDDPSDDRPVWGFRQLQGEQVGLLRCCRCGRVFEDTWPTDPFPSYVWCAPECPDCGSGWFTDFVRGDMAGRGDSRRAQLLTEGAIATDHCAGL